jgi:hypothetical protein
MRAVEVALPFVEVEKVKRGMVWATVERPAKESVPQGVEVPMPSAWLAVSTKRKLAVVWVVGPEA